MTKTDIQEMIGNAVDLVRELVVLDLVAVVRGGTETETETGRGTGQDEVDRRMIGEIETRDMTSIGKESVRAQGAEVRRERIGRTGIVSEREAEVATIGGSLGGNKSFLTGKNREETQVRRDKFVTSALFVLFYLRSPSQHLLEPRIKVGSRTSL